MRALALLLLLAGAAAAQDDPVRRALDEGRYEDALALTGDAPQEPLRRYERAQAICGIAREIRRREGYVAAIDYLERRLDHPLILKAYAECCVWGGEEERGLRGLSAAGGEGSAGARMLILKESFRYEEAAALAREEGWADWEAWARGEAALRGRLRARAARAAWVAAGFALLLAGAWALVRRCSSSARATA